MQLPEAARALQPDRDQLEQLLGLLEASEDAVERADGAKAIVPVAARYENATYEALVPALCEAGAEGVADRLVEDQQHVRDALGEMRARSRHVKPINAHIDDPEGFEEALRSVTDSLRVRLQGEHTGWIPVVEGLDPSAAQRLQAELEGAVSHASTLPDPPHNPVSRTVAAVAEAIDRALSDESTPWHPATDRIDSDSTPSSEVDGSGLAR
jgi:hypothetical protein